MNTSLFALFKIGIGPSSSHTVGPMVAARRFALKMVVAEEIDAVRRLRIDLYGSLAHTGMGHGTDKAVILELCGLEPETVDPANANWLIEKVLQKRIIKVLGDFPCPFSTHDIHFRRDQALPFHPNGMTFTAFNVDREIVRAENFYSIGGGFVVGEEGPGEGRPAARFPYPFRSAAELLGQCERNDLKIWELMLKNESVLRPESEVFAGITRIWQTMESSIERGMTAVGILPGDLKVRRRAEGMASRLRAKPSNDALAPLDWVSVYAIAVNEENAAGGRVVTAPTNGAAGIIPAVARYLVEFCPEVGEDGLFRYFLTAAAIGILYKENASISGAEVGCQGEVGVAPRWLRGDWPPRSVEQMDKWSMRPRSPWSTILA
jgi:L-serine dehydratase